jgi:uncharacterized protein (TIGR02996 family)
VTAAADPFLRAVIADPDDDLPRLIAADWLDEHGQPERAEFIRAQVELAKLEPDCCNDVECPCKDLRSRERELWKANWLTWSTPVCRACGVEGQSVFAADGEDEVCTYPASRWRWRFRRGFVSEATCTAADWLANADALLAACPVRGKRYDEESHYREFSRDGLVRLTTWPELFIVVGEQSVSLTASNDFRVRPGIAEIRLLDDGHVCVKQIEPKLAAVRAGDYSRAELVQRALAAEWPGVRFEFPPAARPEQLNWATIATMTPRRGTGGRVAADPPGDPRGVIDAMERTAHGPIDRRCGVTPDGHRPPLPGRPSRRPRTLDGSRRLPALPGAVRRRPAAALAPGRRIGVAGPGDSAGSGRDPLPGVDRHDARVGAGAAAGGGGGGGLPGVTKGRCVK